MIAENFSEAAGKDPLSFLLSGKKDRFQYFHPRELLNLVVRAKNGKAFGAGSDKKKAECLLELDKLFKNDALNQEIVKEAGIADEWQNIVANWDALDLDKPVKTAAEKNNKLNRELDAAKNITRAPGNMFTGIAGMVKDDDPHGAAVVGGVGQAFNFLVDQTINSENEEDVKKEAAKIDQEMVAALASKWTQAMAIFDQIDRL